MWSTVLAVTMVVLVLFALWRSFRIMRKRRASSSYMQYFVGVRSAFIFLAMVIPILYLDLWAMFPNNLKTLYCWLPFWFCFMVTPALGSTIHVVYHVFRGITFATLALLLLNYLMPGGAGEQPDYIIKKAWLPGGYNPVCAYIYIVLFVYITFASRLSVDTKYFALAMFAQSIVMYMDPNDKEYQKGVLWTWDYQMSWSSPVLCQIYVVLLAAACSVLTVPIVSCRRQHRVDYLCQAQANKGLQNLACDSMGCLERLILHFREETSTYALESSFLYIRQLGTRRTAIEKLLAEARWECCGKASLSRLLRTQQFADVLRKFRQVLRIELDLLRYNSDALVKSRSADKVGDHLQNFVVSCRDALTTLSGFYDSGRHWDEVAHQEVTRTILQADLALRMALQELRKTNCNSESALMSTAFIDSLRICTSSIMDFLNAENPKDTRPGVIRRLAPDRLFTSREQHMNALRNSISWILALLWSLYQRGYKSGCVTCLSFVFSATMGSLFDRNINRMLGVSMGMILGNLPAVILMEEPGGNPAVDNFEGLQGLIIYICIMWITYTLGMYGYLGTGAKYSYGCMLWAGFAGVQMLWHLQNKGTASEHRHSVIFMDMLDQFLACFIVLVTDLTFARCFGGLTLDRVAKSVPNCLDQIADLVEEFVRQDPLHADISPLQKGIASSRFWDGEAQTEDLVWSLLWSAPYKGDLIHVILDQCDDMYVAAYAIKASAERCSSSAVTAILNEMFVESSPTHSGCRSLSESARLYAHITRAALSEDSHIGINELHKAKIQDIHMTMGSMRRAYLGTPLLSTFSENIEDSFTIAGSTINSPEVSLVTVGNDQKKLVPCTWSAAVAVRANACAFRLALQRMEVLIREHEFWVSEAWAFSNLEDSLGRQASGDECFQTSACGTPSRSRTSTMEGVPTTPSHRATS